MVRTKNKVLQRPGQAKHNKTTIVTGTTALPSYLIAAKHVVLHAAMAWERVKSLKPPKHRPMAVVLRSGGCKFHDDIDRKTQAVGRKTGETLRPCCFASHRLTHTRRARTQHKQYHVQRTKFTLISGYRAACRGSPLLPCASHDVAWALACFHRHRNTLPPRSSYSYPTHTSHTRYRQRGTYDSSLNKEQAAMMSAGQQQDQYSGQMDGQNSMTLDEPVWHTVVRLRGGGSDGGEVWKRGEGKNGGREGGVSSCWIGMLPAKSGYA